MPAAKSPKEMSEAIIRNLPEKTGRTLDEWIRVLQKDGPKAHKERVAWLRETHSLGHFQATFVSQHADGSLTDYGNEKKLLDALFDGETKELRALYKEFLTLAKGLGKDVRTVTCKGYIGLSRGRQFAIVRPRAGMLQIGFALPTKTELPRGVSSIKPGTLGGSDRITYAMQVNKLGSEVKKALTLAYSADANQQG